MTETRKWWHFEPTINVGHILTVLTLLGGGLGVYVGVFQTLTALVIRVDTLEKATVDVGANKLSITLNSQSIAELRALAESIKATNEKMLEQLTGLRVDVGVLKQLTPVKP